MYGPWSAIVPIAQPRKQNRTRWPHSRIKLAKCRPTWAPVPHAPGPSSSYQEAIAVAIGAGGSSFRGASWIAPPTVASAARTLATNRLMAACC